MRHGFSHEKDPVKDPGIGPKTENTRASSPASVSSSRKPFGRLTNIISSLELGKNKIQNSTRLFSRLVSHFPRFADLSVSNAASTASLGDETENDTDNDNDTTLNDEDLLGSPLTKRLRRKLPPNEKSPSGSPAPPKQAPNGMNFHIRRTQSCLQDPGIATAFDGTESLPNSRLRTFSVSHDLLPRIDHHEMLKIVSGHYESDFDEFVVIDCRFPYEFNGGHIANAINISSKRDLESRLIENRPNDNRKRLLIFHCEYSIFRGPTMAGHLRKADRILNSDDYPRLLYPDIVVLDGGYKKFFDHYKEWCVPQAYVEMKDTKHKRTCEVEMNKVLQASKLTRARSLHQFQPPHSAHSRSSSFTALLTSSEQQLPSPGLTPSLSASQLPRRKNASKVHKKDCRRELRIHVAQPLVNWPSNLSESPLTSDFSRSSSSCFDDDAFAPLSALFRNHSKSLSLLLASVHSSALLVCSETYSSAFTSTESLASCPSPFADPQDYFDSNHTTSLISSHMDTVPTNSPYLFPGSSSGPAMPRRQSSLKSIHRTPRPPIKLSSPTTSSPLSVSGSMFDTFSEMNSGVDSIVATPLTLSLNRLSASDHHGLHRRVHSSQVFTGEELNEEDEDTENRDPYF